MDSNITINIVEPGSSTPVDPVVPNTGLFTNGIGGTEATILGIAAVVILAALIAALYYRKKKQGKVGSLLAIYKQTLKHKKATTIGLTTLAILVSIGTFATLLKLGVKAIDADIQADEVASEETNEVAEVTNGELTIELGDTPVFAYIPTTVTVTEDMPAGYTLKAYSEHPTLSAEGTDKTIDLVTIPEDGLENAGSLTAALTDNTWGLAVEEPESEAQEIYFSLPATADDAVTIATVDDMAAEGSDTITVYYGVYITPDLPYGTYTGASVNYEVEPISTSATVIFDGNNKFYFNGDVAATTNVMEYIPGDIEIKYSHTPNVNDEGIQTEGEMYPLDSNETFVYEFEGVDNVYVDVVKTGNDSGCGPNQDDYFSIWSGAHSDFTAKANWETALSLNGSNGKNVFDNDGKYDGAGINIEGDAVTIAYTTNDQRQSYCPRTGYGYYAKVIGYNPNIATAGEYEVPTTDGAYHFLGWSEDAGATTPTYTSAADIERALSLTTGETVTLYAISEPAIIISYNGNGADTATNMGNVEQYTTNVETTSTVDLLASNFTREGYGFVGWSTDQNAWKDLTDDDETNNPVIYGPNQTITVDPATTTKLALYAVWAPAEENNGVPVTLQNWTGCSALTTTTYNSETGTLNVGKNTITALTDARDGNAYTVARLADGNCWTTENLRLDDEPELSQNNTNNPSLPLTNNYAEQTTSNYLSATSNDWCTNGSAECYDQSNLNTNNTALTATSPAFSQDFTNSAHNSGLDANIASYGNYYNWYSATAGNGKYETGSNVTVGGDICPTGWHLPYGGNGTGEKGGNTSGGFYYLNKQMGGNTSSTDSNNWRSFPNNFVYSGYWSGSSVYNRGSYGFYWSSTANNTYFAYYLYFNSDGVGPGTSNYAKNRGHSARCVAPVE